MRRRHDGRGEAEVARSLGRPSHPHRAVPRYVPAPRTLQLARLAVPFSRLPQSPTTTTMSARPTTANTSRTADHALRSSHAADYPGRMHQSAPSRCSSTGKHSGEWTRTCTLCAHPTVSAATHSCAFATPRHAPRNTPAGSARRRRIRILLPSMRLLPPRTPPPLGHCGLSTGFIQGSGVGVRFEMRTYASDTGEGPRDRAAGCVYSFVIHESSAGRELGLPGARSPIRASRRTLRTLYALARCWLAAQSSAPPAPRPAAAPIDAPTQS